MESYDIGGMIGAAYENNGGGSKKWPTYPHGRELDRHKYVSASEAGQCERRLGLKKIAAKTLPFPNWGYAERGNVMENWAAGWLHKGLPAGWTLMFAGDDQMSFVDGYQSGTPDGLIRTATYDYRLWEYKSIDPRTNWSKLPKREHFIQVQQNMDLVGHNLQVPVRAAQITYMDASNFQKSKEFLIEADHNEMDRLQARAKRIMSAERGEELEAEGLFMENECDRCEFTKECSAIVMAQKIGQKTAEEKVAENVFR